MKTSITLLSRSKSWSYSRSVSSALEITCPARTIRYSIILYSKLVRSTIVSSTFSSWRDMSSVTGPAESSEDAQPPLRRSSALTRALTSSK